MNKPLISVIVPVYNTERYLPRCFRAIENQTYKELEIIVVDDGSTDCSNELCEEFSKKDRRVKLVAQPNKGLSAARNTGLNHCHGEYITFIDSDDSIEKDYIEYLIRLMKKYDSDISICAHKEIRNKKIIHDFGKGFSEKEFSPEECLKNMLNENGFMVSAWGKMYSSKLFKTVRFPIGKLHEDIGTTYKFVTKAEKIAYGPKSKYLYYQHKSSIVNSGFNEQKLDIISQTDEMCEEILRLYPNLVDTVIARKVQARFSILKLMVNEKELSPKMQIEKKKIKTFIQNHKKYILNSKNAPKRTKFAVMSLALGEPTFKLSWRIYSLFFK